MRNEPVWVEYDDLVIINQGAVEATGEPHLILNHDLLHSAAASPHSHWHYDEVDNVAELAVRLCVGVARAHAFEQGNKRTGYIASTMFLINNGYYLDVPDEEEIAILIEQIVDRKADEAELIEVYEDCLIQTS